MLLCRAMYQDKLQKQKLHYSATQDSLGGLIQEFFESDTSLKQFQYVCRSSVCRDVVLGRLMADVAVRCA